MKTIFDFAYCDGELTPDVIWYQVRVGISKADQTAHQFILRCARTSTSIFYAQHTLQVADFIDAVAQSLFHVGRFASLLLRRKTVDVLQLARFMRQNPMACLNSERVDTAKDAQELSLAGLRARNKMS